MFNSTFIVMIYSIHTTNYILFYKLHTYKYVDNIILYVEYTSSNEGLFQRNSSSLLFVFDFGFIDITYLIWLLILSIELDLYIVCFIML